MTWLRNSGPGTCSFLVDSCAMVLKNSEYERMFFHVRKTLAFKNNSENINHDFSTLLSLLAWIPAKPGQHSDLSKPCWTVEPCWSYGNLPGQRGGVPQPVWDLKSLVHVTSIFVGNYGNLTGNGFLSKAFTSNMVLYCSEALRWAWCVVFGLLFFRCWKRDSCVIWLWQSVTCSVDRYPHASFYYFDIYFELFTQIRRTNYEHLLAEADTQTPCPLRWRRQVKTSCGQLQWMFSWSRLIMLHLDVHGRPISWEPFLWFLMHFQLMSDHVRSATFCNISECAGVTLIHCIPVRQ